jgi:hypothetical protein
LTFDTLPPSAEWTTLSVAGGGGDLTTDANIDTRPRISGPPASRSVALARAGSGSADPNHATRRIVSAGAAFRSAGFSGRVQSRA